MCEILIKFSETQLYYLCKGQCSKIKSFRKLSFRIYRERIFYPDNSQTQQTGIRIDEMIKYKDQDFLDKKDLEFERVLNALK